MSGASQERVRAEILPVEHRWVRSARIRIEAPAQRIFDLLADPRRHAEFDGSGTVRAQVSGPDRLSLGSGFGMSMRIVLPYRISNVVVEFDEGRRIAWRHAARHRWRYELTPVDSGEATIVTETFDARGALFPPGLMLGDVYGKNAVAMARTLVRLKALAEAESSVANG